MLKHIRSRTADKNLLEKGFTLVELLVVIVILGILAAVVVFAVGGTEADAKVKACLTERSTVEAAAQAYKSAQQDGGLPALSTGALVPDFLKRAPVYWTVNANGDLSRGGTGTLKDESKCQP
ncbi:MAG: prepilin-type N-terminal cleavage/methylation domain-containing protein [Acidimicrobiia bacterium]|nr:prepilin-type N-terminal cleavage/methylation domain-containing protein [Acidimicrobiia bacterium]